MEIGQKWLGSQARWWNTQIKVNQTQVYDHMGCPVVYWSFAVRRVYSLTTPMFLCGRHLRKQPYHPEDAFLRFGDIDLMGRSKPARKILLFPSAERERGGGEGGRAETPRP